MQTKIGVFDSGIGGATVLKECIKQCPNFEYIYYSDSKNNPYGDKTREEVLNISSNICDYLISVGCKIIIIACNTASAICVDYLREKYKDIIFIAIEPAIKVAYDSNELNGTLVMATKGTMDSDRFHILYDKYHYDNFYLLSCSGLANIIEHEYEKLEDYLKDNLSIYKNKVKSVVLGCTHYSLIKKEISNVLGDVTFYDGNIGVAKQLKKVLEENEVMNCENKINFIDTLNDKDKEKRFWNILNS